MTVVPKKQIKKNDLDAQIVVLEGQLEEKRFELDAIAEREQALKDDRTAFEKEKDEFFETMHESKKAHDLIRSTTIHVKGAVDKEIEVAQAQYREVVGKVREEERRLIRLNSSCLNAQADLASILNRIKDAEQQVTELTQLVLHFEEMQVKVKEIEDRRELLASTLSNEQESYRLDFIDRKTQLDYLMQQAGLKIKEAQEAEAKYSLFADKLRTSLNDWLVIKNRLEIRFKEHYPELELPL